MAAIGLQSNDLGATAEYLAANGIDTQTRDGMLYVAAEDTLGGGLVIHPEGAEWPPAEGGK